MLQNLLLLALTAVIFWITFFPLISEAITGTEVSVGPPAFRPFVVPLAIVIVLLSGVGPIIAWRRVTVAKLRRSFVFPVAAMVVALVVLVLVPGVIDHGFALLDVLRRDVRRRRGGAGVLPRDARPPGDDLGVAAGGARRLVRRNRRRYGGYIVHLGVAVALIGVAASTSFQHSRTATIGPGRACARRLPVPLCAPDRERLGAEDHVRRGRRRQQRRPAGDDPAHELRPVPLAGSHAGPIGRFFNGSNESRVGLDAGLTHDIWTDINPNVTPLQPLISQGDAVSEGLDDAAQRAPGGSGQRR